MTEDNRRVRIGTRALDMVIPEGYVWVADRVNIRDVPGEEMTIEYGPLGHWGLLTYEEYIRRPDADLVKAASGRLALHTTHCQIYALPQ